MGNKKANYELSGPLHLTTIDWKNAHHRRSVAASLVNGCYTLERFRLADSQAIDHRWWTSFNFILYSRLIDEDESIFGAVYQYNPPNYLPNDNSPRYVIAFRGTLMKPHSILRDFNLNLHVIMNLLHKRSRSKIAIEAVLNTVREHGEAKIWLAGHSLGASMAMLAGKNTAKSKNFIECFLFNPPFISVPIHPIKKKLKAGLQITGSVIITGLSVLVMGKQALYPSTRNRLLTAGLSVAVTGKEKPFDALSTWVPYIFVNPGDYICREYIGYFERRKRMEDWGAGRIERVATQNSVPGLFLHLIGEESEPLHSIPSACLTVNSSPAPHFHLLKRLRRFKLAHGLQQWWQHGLHEHLQSNTFMYNNQGLLL